MHKLARLHYFRAMDEPSAYSSERRIVPQPHGGYLVPGAGGGPQPGSGRPKSEVRKRLKGAFSNRVKILKEIADDGKLRPSDRLKAVDLMAKYGLGEAKGYDEALVEALGEVVADELSEEVWERIRQKWVAVIGLHVRGG